MGQDNLRQPSIVPVNCVDVRPQHIDASSALADDLPAPTRLLCKSLLSRVYRGASTLLQVSLFCVFAWSMQQLSLILHLPVPGSVLGLGVVLLMLSLQWLPERTVALGAAWLLGELLLFFIPPVVSVLKYQSLFVDYGVNLILSLVIGCAAVLLGTGFVVDKMFRFERQRNRRRRHASQALMSLAQVSEQGIQPCTSNKKVA